MSIGIKFKVNITGFKKSIKNLREGIPNQLVMGMSNAGREVSGNIIERFSRSYPSIVGKQSKGILGNIKASTPMFDGRSVRMGIGNVADIDRATEVMAKSTGKVYHLWRLLEFGYGMKGGFRDDLYDIYPIYPTSAQGQSYYGSMGGTRRKGVHHSDPERRYRPALVFYSNGSLVFASHVKHPGAEGRFFFLTMSRDWYSEDRSVVIRHLGVAISKVLEKVNYKGKGDA